MKSRTHNTVTNSSWMRRGSSSYTIILISIYICQLHYRGAHHMWVYECMYIFLYVKMYVYECICVSIYRKRYLYIYASSITVVRMICMYMNVYVFLYMHIFLNVDIHSHILLYTYIYIECKYTHSSWKVVFDAGVVSHMYIFMCICVCTHICLRVYIYHTHIHLSCAASFDARIICIWIYMHANIYMDIYLCTYICVYIYIHI